MKMRFLTLTIGLAALVAGCGSSGSSTSSYGGSAKTTSQPATTTSATMVALKDNAKLGKILVDSKGDTLYLFEKDKGPTSTCNGACAGFWPPDVTSGKPTAGAGVTASMLGTTKRSDGKTQVTYNGHPLYYFSLDKSAGQTNGQGLDKFGAEWYVLGANGNKVEGGGKSSSSSSGSSSGGSSTTSTSGGSSGGYGY
jgi:predicted lipoprotein with Yx(FWY)xxD motif